jgi:hypothetical protein
MMRALLFLSVVGAVIYGFLVITGVALSGGNTKDSLTIQAKPDHSADDRLSSWDSYLPSRSQGQNPQLATSQQPVTLPSQERSDPSQDSEVYRLALAASKNRKNREEASDDSLKSESPVVAPVPTQVAAESTTEPLTTKPPVRKSSKRSRSAKHGAVVAAADPWNGRWARHADRHRGFFGLFMFHPAPTAMSLGRRN